MTEGAPLKVLVVEDEADIAHYIRKLLVKKFGVEVEISPNLFTGRVLIEAGGFDIVTIDYQLPDGDGLSLLEEITRESVHPPVIVVTGQGDERTAVRAFAAGAAGYVVKDAKLYAMLPDVFEKVVAGLNLERMRGQLQDTAARFQVVIDSLPLMIAGVDEAGNFTYANRVFASAAKTEPERLVGMRAEAVMGKRIYGQLDARLRLALRGEQVTCLTVVNRNGRLREFEVTIVPRIGDDGNVREVFAFGSERTGG